MVKPFCCSPVNSLIWIETCQKIQLNIFISSIVLILIFNDDKKAFYSIRQYKVLMSTYFRLFLVLCQYFCVICSTVTSLTISLTVSLLSCSSCFILKPFSTFSSWTFKDFFWVSRIFCWVVDDSFRDLATSFDIAASRAIVSCDISCQTWNFRKKHMFCVCWKMEKIYHIIIFLIFCLFLKLEICTLSIFKEFYLLLSATSNVL